MYIGFKLVFRKFWIWANQVCVFGEDFVVGGSDYIHKYVHTYIHAYIHTYIHACIHTYIHAYVHYIHNHTHIHKF